VRDLTDKIIEVKHGFKCVFCRKNDTKIALYINEGFNGIVKSRDILRIIL